VSSHDVASSSTLAGKSESSGCHIVGQSRITALEDKERVHEEQEDTTSMSASPSCLSFSAAPSASSKTAEASQSYEDEPCFRKPKSKHRILQTQQDCGAAVAATSGETAGTAAGQLSQPVKRLTNPYEQYRSFRKTIRDRWNRVSSVTPKAPPRFESFSLVTRRHSEAATTDQSKIVMFAAPSDLPEDLKEMFDKQETDRQNLQREHSKEKEKVTLLYELEILRVGSKIAMVLSNQPAPRSACTLLYAHEVHCMLDSAHDQSSSAERSRCNGRHFSAWQTEVNEKYDKIKTDLLLRHHEEVNTLQKIQKLHWEWKLKENGSCDLHSTPTIAESFVPLVPVDDGYSLTPSAT